MHMPYCHASVLYLTHTKAGKRGSLWPTTGGAVECSQTVRQWTMAMDGNGSFVDDFPTSYIIGMTWNMNIIEILRVNYE